MLTKISKPKIGFRIFTNLFFQSVPKVTEIDQRFFQLQTATKQSCHYIGPPCTAASAKSSPTANRSTFLSHFLDWSAVGQLSTKEPSQVSSEWSTKMAQKRGPVSCWTRSRAVSNSSPV